jgi:NAD+ synthase (glutamine-hydrolysing)
MKIGIAQINTTVGDLFGNQQRILDAYRNLVANGAELILYPELVICGYPPRDLLLKSRFVHDIANALQTIAREIHEVPAIIGFVEQRSDDEPGRPFYNSAAWCESGEIKTIARKSLLPNYDVFDEERYFEPANAPTIYEWQGKRIGITICEDIWTSQSVPTRRRYCKDPVASLADPGVDLLLNLSASPWHGGKNETRESLIADAAKRCQCPVVYCNSVGGNDELIFDGASCVFHPKHGMIAGLDSFQEANCVVDTNDPTTHFRSEHFNLKDNAAIHDALVLGLRDYAHKSGFKKALIGLSGGIDSAVVAALAVESLGSANVIGVALPSAISSQHSRDDAAALAQNLNIEYHELPIADIVQSANTTLASLFEGLEKDTTEENIQARTRGLLLMALSNKFGALLLTTGNKSELAVGYCTLYGDMCGGLAVISDVPKTKVYDLARFINRKREIIPENTITKPPSAELSPDQKDEDSLPPYLILDEILRLYVERGLSSAEIIESGHEEAVVRDIIRKVDLNEYKRKQAAPGLKITPLAFGVGRRIPIVQKYVS